ncbi:unnamed protein product [Brassica oleracea var. botrytis]|uniref:(rape) hypothetical protein n=2 Tax=Brassica napus TaxID=3708 RepID=A0A078GGX2_BRANA|nr:unnamed protein product [Brassica napus]CDY25705.1 BnaC03g69700D [Brassica napus]
MAIENQEKTIRVIQPKKTVNMISLRNLSWQGLRARTIKENYDNISEKRKLTPVEVIVADIFTVVLKNTDYTRIFSH